MIAKARVLPISFLLLTLGATGCRIDTHKNGKNDDVSIGTPFGSLNVKTDDASVVAGLGLTPYPGATFVHKKGDDDDGAADVNLSFGSFKLNVHAVDLRTGDGQDKVLAFYRKDMGRYGAVLTCRGTDPVGEPTRTGDGLSCNSERHGVGEDKLELRAGSPLHQHIVAVRPDDGGTRIGLVALDLPAGLKEHDRGDRE